MILEKDILKSCIEKLEWWEHLGVVSHWERINSGSMMVNGRYIKMAKKGFPDLMSFVRKGSDCWIVFLECKRPDGGNWSDAQREFASKFTGLNNVVYEIVTNPKQVDATIEQISEHYKFKLDSLPDKIG